MLFNEIHSYILLNYARDVETFVESAYQCSWYTNARGIVVYYRQSCE